MSEKEQISEEIGIELAKLITNDKVTIGVYVGSWKQAGYIKESAVDKFLNYKCSAKAHNGLVLADDMSIIRTLGAEAILELQKQISELKNIIDKK